MKASEVLHFINSILHCTERSIFDGVVLFSRCFSELETTSLLKLLLRYYEKSVIFSFEVHITGVPFLSVDFFQNISFYLCSFE